MARPTRRSGSTFIQFKKRIPVELRSQAAGKTFSAPVGDDVASARIGPRTETIQFSLRTRDPLEAATRQAIVLTQWNAFLESLRHGVQHLSHKEIVALSGEAYRDLVSSLEDDPGSRSRWEWLRGWVQHNWPLHAPAENGPNEMPYLDNVLARRHLVVDHESRIRLHEELGRILMEAADRLAANADGDYSEDGNLKRFPAFPEERQSDLNPTAEQVRLDDLVNGWWREQKAVGRAQSTYVNYRGVMRRFAAFLQHDDARRIRTEDVIRFKDARLADGKSARTVNDNDLAAINSIFGWAVVNARLQQNPARGVTIKGIRKAKKRGLTESEAVALLRAALGAKRGQESVKTYLARRWAAWVMAYTGARVGEVLQLRREDVRREDDHWAIYITPEAGAVKGGRSRLVPLHPHLIELGFIAEVSSRPAGHLFLDPNPHTGDVLGPLQGVKNRVAEFARTVVPDGSVAPNHGWRQRFITLCRKHAVDQELRRMITGHTGEGVDERDYGEPAGLYREICKLPTVTLD